jgi:hypothetical protein
MIAEAGLRPIINLNVSLLLTIFSQLVYFDYTNVELSLANAQELS